MTRCFSKIALRFDRRGAVAVIVGLSAPLLVAITGLSVDIGYWYQAQTTLQSAADSAALTAAETNANANYAVTTPSQAEPYAVNAANYASNSQFNLSSTNVALSLSNPAAAAGTTVNHWVAIVTAPRSDFFSAVQGMGISGLGSGTQSATASADYKLITTTTKGSCLLSLGSAGQSVIGNVDSTGNATIDANGCNIAADSNACGANTGGSSAIQAVGNSVIETTNTTGSSIITAGCVSASGNATISAAGGTASNNYNIETGAAVQPDPLAYMGDAPTFWYDTGAYLNSIPACLEAAITYNSSNVANGIDTNPNDIGSKTNVLIYPPTVNGTPLTYCQYPPAASLPVQGTAYFCQTYNCANYGTNSDYGVLGNGVGVSYFFTAGLSPNAQTTVNFGPGIYYFDGGSTGLNVGGSSAVTTIGTGSTFVFEGNTSYSLGGSSSALNLNAPSNTANCVEPQNYNSTANSYNNFVANLYNMTAIENGQGICGVLIYEARNDTATGTLDGGATSTINGLIYTPKAAFKNVGNGTISSTAGGTLGILSDNFQVTGNGTLNVSVGNNSSDLAGQLIKSTTTLTSSVLLVN